MTSPPQVSSPSSLMEGTQDLVEESLVFRSFFVSRMTASRLDRDLWRGCGSSIFLSLSLSRQLRRVQEDSHRSRAHNLTSLIYANLVLLRPSFLHRRCKEEGEGRKISVRGESKTFSQDTHQGIRSLYQTSQMKTTNQLRIFRNISFLKYYHVVRRVSRLKNLFNQVRIKEFIQITIPPGP